MVVIFIDNKYTKVYYNIVKNSKEKTYTSETERHHIIPKSLGGDNRKENVVTVSIREHYILHKLLVKMVEGENLKKMWWALHRMSTKHLKIYNSKLYEKFRMEWSVYLKENHHSKRIDNWGDRMSIVVKKSWNGDDERRRKFSESMKQTVKNIRENDEEAYITELNKRAKIGGVNSKEKNATRIEYCGKIYLGWNDLLKFEGISKSNCKKYYTNGYDPTFRSGKDGAIKYTDILAYSNHMNINALKIIEDMFNKNIISEKSKKSLTIEYYKENR